MEQPEHYFSEYHGHPLSLVYLRTENHHKKDSDDKNYDDEEDGRDDDSVVELLLEHQHGGKCNMCKEDIYSFHLCYYECNRCKDYSLHKFCAELPLILKNHHSNPAHDLTWINRLFDYTDYFPTNVCDVCNNRILDETSFGFHCSICQFYMDIICATMSEQKMVHPSHPHQLQRMIRPIISKCHACDNEHKGTFYHCATCVWFWIHLDCALLPAKLLIQQPTNDSFTHSHPLTLAYSFPFVDYDIKYMHRCRVCNSNFRYFLWLYKCDKCRYYAHVDCATSKKEPFMSIFLMQDLGKTLKNFQDDDHPNLLKCPFPDESNNLLTYKFSNQIKDFLLANKENDGDEMINHFGHQHPLVFFNTSETSSLSSKSVSLHNPMKRIQLFCDGCVKPITMVPFYKCSQIECCFVLHTWCATMLPSEIPDHPGHPQHSVLALITRIPGEKFTGIFWCDHCILPSNGFAYACTTNNCGYRVDINCAFLPREITHEAHRNHLLSLVSFSSKHRHYCFGCLLYLERNQLVYHCPSCNFYLHTSCALLLPKIVRNKYADRHHPLTLRYEPVENHPSEYFCDICEEEFDPRRWFYHCATCVASVHSECAPVILQLEKAVPSRYKKAVPSMYTICAFLYLNVKFGGSFEIGDHPHRFTFDQGIECDGRCSICNDRLRNTIIYKCFECKFAFHNWCAYSYEEDGNVDSPQGQEEDDGDGNDNEVTDLESDD